MESDQTIAARVRFWSSVLANISCSVTTLESFEFMTQQWNKTDSCFQKSPNMFPCCVSASPVKGRSVVLFALNCLLGIEGKK